MLGTDKLPITGKLGRAQRAHVTMPWAEAPAGGQRPDLDRAVVDFVYHRTRSGCR